MNICIIDGNIVRDIELRTTTNSKVANFTVATKGFKDKTNFVPCVAWGKTAEILSEYGKKGKFIILEGEFTSRNYEKDGNRVYVYELKVNNVAYMERSKPEPQQDIAF